MPTRISFVEYDDVYTSVIVEDDNEFSVSAVTGFIKHILTFFDKSKSAEAKRLGIHVDCNVYFYDESTKTIPTGLIPRVAKALKVQYPTCKISLSDDLMKMFKPPHGKVDRQDIVAYAATLKLYNAKEDSPITPYEHQYDLATKAINGRRISLLACTSAGKSLSMMIIARYLMEREHKKILIVVPSTNLVEQLFSDFHDDYGWTDAKKYCTLIHGTSSDKLSNSEKAHLAALNLGEEHMLKNITISTWQSLQPKLNPDKPTYNPDFFKVFDAVLVDEAHGTRGESIRSILGACTNANNFKVGVSGTLPDDGMDACLIEGALGYKEEVIRLHTLIEMGILTPVEVYSILIPYPPELCSRICAQRYEDEFEIVTNNSSRKDIMTMLIKSGHITTAENTVMLYKSVNNLELMLDYLKENHPEFNYHVIKGDISVDARERIRKSIEEGGGNIIVATYGCMKQGVNIKLLHNLVMAEPAKSPYMVIQSIGRIVRPHKAKKLAKVFDLVDNASYWTKPRGQYASHIATNCMVRHYEERKKYYTDENIKINELNLTGMYVAPIVTDDIMNRRKKAATEKKTYVSKNPYKKKFFR